MINYNLSRANPLIYIILVFSVSSFSQQSSHFTSIDATYLQIKEGLNYGLVFRGPGLRYGFNMVWEDDKRIIGYEGRFGFCYLRSRGISAGNINFVPIRLDYLFKSSRHGNVHFGPFIIAEYNYELYPDLQSGYSFWSTHYSAGAIFEYQTKLASGQLNFLLSSTLLGVTSRPPIKRDSYYFDLSLGHALRFLHQDFRFASLNSWNQTEFELRWKPKQVSPVFISYLIDYYGYFKEPRLTMLDQSIRLIIVPRKKRL